MSRIYYLTEHRMKAGLLGTYWLRKVTTSADKQASTLHTRVPFPRLSQAASGGHQEVSFSFTDNAHFPLQIIWFPSFLGLPAAPFDLLSYTGHVLHL